MKLLIKSCLAVALFAGICLAGCKEKDMSMKMNNPRNIRGVISYKRSFGDLNDVQLATAKKIGIRPISTREKSFFQSTDCGYHFGNALCQQPAQQTA